MRFLVKNKLFSFGGNSVVTNENGELVYNVKGSWFSNRITRMHKKVVKDANKKKLYYVRNKFWHKPFVKSAIIYNEKKKKLAVVTNSHILKHGYEVKGATEPIKVEGTGWNLDIMLGEKKIGHISLPEVKSVKDALRIADAYVLDVDDAEDVPFLTAMMIAIDNIVDQHRNNRS